MEHPQEVEEPPAVVAPRRYHAAFNRNIQTCAERVVERNAVGGKGTLAVLRSRWGLGNQRDIGDWCIEGVCLARDNLGLALIDGGSQLAGRGVGKGPVRLPVSDKSDFVHRGIEMRAQSNRLDFCPCVKTNELGQGGSRRSGRGVEFERLRFRCFGLPTNFGNRVQTEEQTTDGPQEQLNAHHQTEPTVDLAIGACVHGVLLRAIVTDSADSWWRRWEA